MKTQIDLDDEALRQAAEVLGTPSKVTTVNAALREVVKQAHRRRLLDLAESGAFDPTVRHNAWS